MAIIPHFFVLSFDRGTLDTVTDNIVGVCIIEVVVRLFELIGGNQEGPFAFPALSIKCLNLTRWPLPLTKNCLRLKSLEVVFREYLVLFNSFACFIVLQTCRSTILNLILKDLLDFVRRYFECCQSVGFFNMNASDRFES